MQPANPNTKKYSVVLACSGFGFGIWYNKPFRALTIAIAFLTLHIQFRK